MLFLKLIQMDPHTLRQYRQVQTDRHLRLVCWVALLTRAIFIVFLAIGFILALTKLFGEKNTPMAVVIFCILFSHHYVSLGYRKNEEYLGLAMVILLLCFAPTWAMLASGMWQFGVHILSLWLLLGLSCRYYPNVHGGLFAFSYVYLVGNPVKGTDLILRLGMCCVGIVLSWISVYLWHRKDRQNGCLLDLFHIRLGIKTEKEWELWRWRLCLALSLLLTISHAFSLPRLIWAGFACNCMLAPYDIRRPAWQRFWHRLLGVLEGCVLFFVLQAIVPIESHFLLGPIGGICLGLCTHYRYQTLWNTLGALLAASAIYTVSGAIILRIGNTFLGLFFALIILMIEEYLRYIGRKRSRKD